VPRAMQEMMRMFDKIRPRLKLSPGPPPRSAKPEPAGAEPSQA
jgi:hypothetical protein